METVEKTKPTAAEQRVKEYRARAEMAEFVEQIKRQYVPGMYASLTIEVAAEVLRTASITHIRRARRAVNKRRKGC